LQVRFPNHGGLTPSALDAAVVVPRTLFASFCKRDPLPNHGGLTPAALDAGVVVRRTLFCFLEVLVLAEVNRPLAVGGTVLTNVHTCKLNSAHVMADPYCWQLGVNKCLHL
jgi:hypothetical protein